MDPVNRQANNGRINSCDHTIFVLLRLAQMICKRASLVSYHDMMKSNHQSCCVRMSPNVTGESNEIIYKNSNTCFGCFFFFDETFVAKIYLHRAALLYGFLSAIYFTRMRTAITIYVGKLRNFN